MGFYVQDENESGAEEEDTPGGRKRRKIRKILKDKKLSQTTVDAAKAEEDRRKRTEERQKLVYYDLIYIFFMKWCIEYAVCYMLCNSINVKLTVKAMMYGICGSALP